MLSGYHERHPNTTAMIRVHCKVSRAKYSEKCKVSIRSGLTNLYIATTTCDDPEGVNGVASHPP